ncbi:hypothetical protein [Sphingopyxis macrogoltabida]|uniref:Uncharacterized protein n=1 Tax=Sphingopyxis macrogoltabida TaxID=33050 RepID=A0AAC9AVR4_SPHMC|nr:hypothetical protein [Sphingopyxis macrogoltabida]ALJ14246.1 hypothetical protein LH19_15355 [Sphingopyxis macrogoltabida]AMU90512.1 hypothetical protein ATM17_15930 [Sphingopyxis macrogoltabida]
MTAPRVSDHALLRFLERSGVQVEQLRATVEASLDRAGRVAAEIAASEYLIVVHDLTFVVRDGTVTTILPEGSPGFRARALVGAHRKGNGQQ